jgi:hypothetical protein
MATTQTLYRRPVSWPFRLLGWLCLTTALLIVLGFAAFVGTSAYYEFTRTTSGDVKGMIERDLAKNATTDQILLFLTTHGIQHGEVQPSTDDDRKLLDAGVPTGTPTITGMIPNDGYALQLKDVVVTFVLDAEGRLDDYVVYEVGR